MCEDTSGDLISAMHRKMVRENKDLFSAVLNSGRRSSSEIGRRLVDAPLLLSSKLE